MAGKTCPSCKKELPDSDSFPPWCPACNWNIEAETTFFEWKRTALDELIDKARGRYAKKQFEYLVTRDPDSLGKRWTLGKVVAFALALVVNGFPLALVAAGIWLLAANWPEVWAFVWSAVFFLGAWVFRPRVQSNAKRLLDRADAPRLYAFVDRIAAENNAPPAHALVVDGDFNASFQKAGVPGRPIVTIGLSLWTILEPQERVALISHEFAHGQHGDTLAHGFVFNAISNLAGVSSMLAPDPNDTFSLLFSPILTPLSRAFRWSAYAMLVLLWQIAQEAEFMADYAATRVSGTEAAQSLLRKLAFGAYLPQVLEPISMSVDWQQHNFFSGFRSFVKRLPPLEQERALRLFERGDFAKVTTHPPAGPG